MTGAVALRLVSLPLLLTGGCALLRHNTAPSPPKPVVEVIEDKVPVAWREVVKPADQERLDHLRDAWTSGLGAAARFKTAISAEGPLLDPATALPRAAPSPGAYLCRVIKLGARPALESFKPFNCFVDAEGELLTMVKSNGTLRPAGRLWADSDTRMIFLGGLAEPGQKPAPYSDDDTHNVAGVLERVAAFRWRLAVPYPRGGGALDVYELSPLIPGAPVPARP